MHLIVHVIPVKPGSVDAARAMFDEVVPPMAERFSSWRGARFTATDDNTVVTVGMWADEDEMREFLAQPAFAEAMAGFSQFFAGEPSAYVAKELTTVGPVAT